MKLRRAKARMSPAEEAHLWSEVFDHGCFLLAGTAELLGVDEKYPEAAARLAWRRLGRLYLAKGLGRREGYEECGRGRWALDEFGEPEQCR